MIGSDGLPLQFGGLLDNYLEENISLADFDQFKAGGGPQAANTTNIVIDNISGNSSPRAAAANQSITAASNSAGIAANSATSLSKTMLEKASADSMKAPTLFYQEPGSISGEVPAFELGVSGSGQKLNSSGGSRSSVSGNVPQTLVQPGTSMPSTRVPVLQDFVPPDRNSLLQEDAGLLAAQGAAGVRALKHRCCGQQRRPLSP